MGRRAWLARRLLASAFVVVHVGATVLWVMPPCPLRNKVIGPLCYYILPLGLWQCWTMFSPDPPTSAVTLDAEVVDRNGLRYNFAFPRQSDYSVWSAMPRFRHPKFAMNLTNDEPEVAINRLFAARHVARQLGIPAEAFPIDVSLIFKGLPCPQPGCLPPDVPPAKQLFPVGTYRFEGVNEVRP
jgi:hypothetical protein